MKASQINCHDGRAQLQLAQWLPILLFVASFQLPAWAEMDPKVKVVSSMAVYGAVGGAFLGTASLAFGTEVRTIFVGASLGLYAGILFGSYIVLSYTAKKNGWGRRQNSADFYPGSNAGPYGGSGAGGSGPPSDVQRWNPYGELQLWRQDGCRNRFVDLRARPHTPALPLFVPIFNWDF